MIDKLNYIGYNCMLLALHISRVTAQPVSRRIAITVVRGPNHIRSYGICDRRSSAGSGVLGALWFPLPIIIPPIAPHLLITGLDRVSILAVSLNNELNNSNRNHVIINEFRQTNYSPNWTRGKVFVWRMNLMQISVQEPYDSYWKFVVN
jgi:hypothetical protein